MDTDGRRFRDAMRSVDVDALNELTQRVIGCAYTVSNRLGCGHFEKVYENAMCIEFRKSGLKYVQQAEVDVLYDGLIVGQYFADLVVEGAVLVELKAVGKLDDLATAQCLSYLKVTHLPICLLLNFGQPRVEVKRFLGHNVPRG